MPIDLGQVLTRGPVNLLLAYTLTNHEIRLCLPNLGSCSTSLR